jgi:glycosyltransferase involved in cell wall biosynthesis
VRIQAPPAIDSRTSLSSHVPRVSAVIPSHNCAQFIGRAVECVLSQTLDDCEVVVVDDGSTDDTAAVLKPYRQNPRVHYIYQQSRGVSAARNVGARLSRGEYLAFLDADDLLVPNALQLMAEQSDRTGASWCVTDILKVNGEKREIRRTDIPPGNLFHAILKHDFPCRAMFFRRKDFFDVGMYDESLVCREDWDLNLRMVEQNKLFVYLNEPVYLYSWRDGSLMTASYAKVLANTEKLLRKHHKRLADAGDRAAAKIYAHKMWDLGRRYFYLIRDYSRTFACLRESLAYDLNFRRMFHPLLHNFRRFAERTAAHESLSGRNRSSAK